MIEPIPLRNVSYSSVNQNYSSFKHSYSSGRLSFGYVDELCGDVFDSVSKYAV